MKPRQPHAFSAQRVFLVSLAIALISGCTPPAPPETPTVAEALPAAPATPEPQPTASRSAPNVVEIGTARPTAVPTPRSQSVRPAPKLGRVSPIGVIVENAPAARPQSGLADADVVYEAMAEGGIPRFLAMYVEHEAPVIGPVRSARHYFVNLAAEFGAALVHFGSSPQGYEALAALGLTTLDGVKTPAGIWRTSDRAAPHNAYTGTAEARAALNGRSSGRPGSWAGFTFASSAPPPATSQAGEVRVRYAPWGYEARYEYDPQRGRYLRLTDGAPHMDADGRQIEAATVIVMIVSATVLDDEGRLDLGQVGQGSTFVAARGSVSDGRWAKRNRSEPTRFTTVDGRPIQFDPGPIWVQIVQPDTLIQRGATPTA